MKMNFVYAFSILLLFSVTHCYAHNYVFNKDIIYVNNKIGDDSFNGKSSTKLGASGPVKTIQKALDIVAVSGTVEIINTGVPYVSGNRVKKGGTPGFPLTIEGNGAVISGLGEVSATEWTLVEENIFSRPFWPMSNQLKTNKDYNYWIGIPQIWRVNNLPAKNCVSKEELKNSPGGFWWNKEEKTVWFNLPKNKNFTDLNIMLPIQRGHGSGINVNGSMSNILIKNLRAEFAFNDGFSAHGTVQNLVFQNCIATDNCGQGFSMHGETKVVVEDCFATRNASSGACDVNAAEVTYKRSVFVNNSFEVGIYTTENVKATYEDCIIANNMPFEQIWQKGKSEIYLKNCLVMGVSTNTPLAIIEAGSINLENCTLAKGASVASFRSNTTGSLAIENSLLSNLKEIILPKNKAQLLTLKACITDIPNLSLSDPNVINTKVSQKNGFPYHKKTGAQLPKSVWDLYMAQLK